MYKIYAFCDAGSYTHFHKLGTGKKNKQGKKLAFEFSICGYQYNHPNGNIVSTISDVKDIGVAWKAEKRSIELMIKNIEKNVKEPSMIFLYTDQETIVSRYTRMKNGTPEKKDNRGHLGDFIKKIRNIEKNSIHTYQFVYVKSTSKSVGKHGVYEKKAWHVLHHEVDRKIAKRMKKLKKQRLESFEKSVANKQHVKNEKTSLQHPQMVLL